MASRRNVADILRRGATASPRERWLRRGFVTAVVSLAFVLLVSVSLLGRSLLAMLAIDPGFDAVGVVTAAVAPPPARYPTDERLATFYAALDTELGQRLGPRSVGIVNELPLDNDRGRVLVSARPSDPAREAIVRVASPSYFGVMRIPLVAGRTFERLDDAAAPARVVVSESLAAELFPRESVVGRAIVLNGRTQPAEIVGVVGDVKHRSLDEPTLPTIYVSAWQSPPRASRLVVRTARPDAMAVIREQVARLDRDLPVYGQQAMSGVVARSPGVPARRVLTAAFLGFSFVAVLLAAIGLFGVVAHDVASRRAELALRLALGANPRRILTATLGQGVWIVGTALCAGVLMSFWASQALSGMVTVSDGLDVQALGAAAAVLIAVGLGAVFPAARRAARVNPLATLRGE
jgi:predicted permease